MPANRRTNSTSTSTSGSGNPGVTKVTTTKQVVPVSPQELDPDVIYTTKHEEWTTSKKVVNHKTKQVETRVQRQIILEDGKVIADSGPQITTRTTEDNTVEETENTQHKTTGDDPPPAGYLAIPGSNRVISEKTETTQTMKETKEENMQLHDESFHDLSGSELHQKALLASDDLRFTENGEGIHKFPGKLTHYTSKSQKVTDKEEVKEVSELKDGQMTTETTHTHHHEEVHDDEVPEDEVDGDVLPEISAETTRKIEYYNEDDDDFDSVSQRFRMGAPEVKSISQSTGRQQDHFSRKMTARSGLDEEEEIRNSETTRWLEDHFGSDQSDVVETTRTHAGGNKITIEMSGGRKAASPRERPSPQQVHVTTFRSASNNVNGHRSSTEKSRLSSMESSNRTGSSQRSPASSPFRWEESPVGTSSWGHKRTPSSLLSSPSSTSSPSKTPTRTFYLGEEGTYKRDHVSSLKAQSSHWKSTPSLLDQTEDLRSGQRRQDSSVHRQSNHHSSDTFRQGSTGHDSYYQVSSLRHPPKSPREIHSPSQTLPRGTKFSKVNSNQMNFTTRTCDKNIQVALSDEETDESGPPSPPPRHVPPQRPPRPYAYGGQRESQTLPRPPPKKSAREKLSASFTNLTSPKKFLFGGGTNSRTKAVSTEVEGQDERIRAFDHNASIMDNGTVSVHNRSRRHDVRAENYRNASEIHAAENRRVLSSRTNRHFMSTPEPPHGRSVSPTYRRATKIHVTPEIHSPQNNGVHSRSSLNPSSPPPRLIRATPLERYCSSSSVSPPDSPSVQGHSKFPPSSRRAGAFNGTRSKSYTDVRAPPAVNSNNYSYHAKPYTVVRNPPNFTPLSSPTEIKGMSDRDHRGGEKKKFFRVKPAKNGGSVVVEVRELDDR